ncbi:MAG: SDR family oxidoreductase [Candidatus Bipolaricaulota bacterium]|nr:SDR family oxidoreductase [Candidatus Bipolaricaulota bacterium]
MGKRTTWREKDPVVLVTGASSGIGRTCADLLSRSGFTVYGGSRTAPSEPPSGWTWLPLDVRDEASVRGAVDRILEEAGRIDVVVNNAGYGIAGPVEETPLPEALDLFQTNFFGALRVCQAVLPHFRARGAGTIVNISSLGGRIPLPYQGLYSASKFALGGLTEALRMEVAPLGIRVVLVEPGDVRTPFPAHRRRVERVAKAYQEPLARALAQAERDEREGVPPEAVARLVLRILRHPRPKRRYTVGPLPQRAAARLQDLLPGRLVEWGIMRHYRVG